MSSLLEMHEWLRRSMVVYRRVQAAAGDLEIDMTAALAFPEIRRSVEQGRRFLRDADARQDASLATQAIASFRAAIARCPAHLTDRAVARVAPKPTARSSALVDVPRLHLPRAAKAFTLISQRALSDTTCARVLDRARSAMMRARREWAEAERTRDDARAQEAARLFDEVASLVPPHVSPPSPTATRTTP